MLASGVKSGPVTFRLSLPRTGFVHGDVVPFIFSVVNNSSLDVRPVIRLVCVINCKGERVGGHGQLDEWKSKQTKLVILREMGTTIMKDDTYLWDGALGQCLKIPGTVPPTITSEQSELIKLNYFLEFEAIVVKSTHVLFSAIVPIYIGTVPLQGVGTINNDDFSFHQHYYRLYENNNYSSINELPPPSYEEATKED